MVVRSDDFVEKKFNPLLLVQDYDTFPRSYSMDKYILEQKSWNKSHKKGVVCTANIFLPNWLKSKSL